MSIRAIHVAAAVSISISPSANGRLSRLASRRPTVDFPTPISPTSAMVRRWTGIGAPPETTSLTTDLEQGGGTAEERTGAGRAT